MKSLTPTLTPQSSHMDKKFQGSIFLKAKESTPKNNNPTPLGRCSVNNGGSSCSFPYTAQYPPHHISCGAEVWEGGSESASRAATLSRIIRATTATPAIVSLVLVPGFGPPRSCVWPGWAPSVWSPNCFAVVTDTPGAQLPRLRGSFPPKATVQVRREGADDGRGACVVKGGGYMKAALIPCRTTGVQCGGICMSGFC